MLRLLSALAVTGLLVALIAVTGTTPTPSVAQNGPNGTPVGSPTSEPTEEPTVEPTEPPDGTPTVEPTETPAGTPVGSPTPEPTATPTPPSNLVVTVYCNRNPELTRVDNIGEGTVTIVGVGPRFGAPVAVERPLGAGRTVIFRSDSGATSGTILTTDELYADNDASEGAIVRVSTGRGFLAKCIDVGAGPGPTPPSNLAVTVYCNRNPELTRVENHGAAAVTIVSVTSRSGVAVETSRLLGPGRTVIFRSDTGATSGTILTTQELYDAGFSGEGAVVRVHTGRGFAASCID